MGFPWDFPFLPILGNIQYTFHAAAHEWASTIFVLGESIYNSYLSVSEQYEPCKGSYCSLTDR